MSQMWPKYYTHAFTTDSTAASGDTYLDTESITVGSGNYQWDAGTNYITTGPITIDYDISSVKFPIKEEAEIYILPDMVCELCMKPLGMFCEDGHYIKTDSEEYRFVHSLKCNKQLGLKYRVKHENQVNKAYHVKCPDTE